MVESGAVVVVVMAISSIDGGVVVTAVAGKLKLLSCTILRYYLYSANLALRYSFWYSLRSRFLYTRFFRSAGALRRDRLYRLPSMIIDPELPDRYVTCTVAVVAPCSSCCVAMYIVVGCWLVVDIWFVTTTFISFIMCIKK